MKEIKAPDYVPHFGYKRPSLFLGGSIEMGNAPDWQRKVVELASDTNWTILNPRRDDWDSSWEQSIHNDKFREQVEWELTALDRAEKILLYLSPDTKSPISLLELGLHAQSHKLIVVCPQGFWRKGNVDIVCVRYNIQMSYSLEKAVSYLRNLRGWNEC
jgi:hypothetical protein